MNYRFLTTGTLQDEMLLFNTSNKWIPTKLKEQIKCKQSWHFFFFLRTCLPSQFTPSTSISSHRVTTSTQVPWKNSWGCRIMENH